MEAVSDCHEFLNCLIILCLAFSPFYFLHHQFPESMWKLWRSFYFLVGTLTAYVCQFHKTQLWTSLGNGESNMDVCLFLNSESSCKKLTHGFWYWFLLRFPREEPTPLVLWLATGGDTWVTIWSHKYNSALYKRPQLIFIAHTCGEIPAWPPYESYNSLKLMCQRTKTQYFFFTQYILQSEALP